MNYAFMSFSCPQATFAEMLALAVQYGYDGVEPRAAGGNSHGVELEASAEQRADFRTQAADAGIAICCLAAGNRFADPADRDAQVAETLLYIDLAADIGAPALRIFGGRIPDGISREAAIGGVSDALSRLAGRAGDRGVVVCMETHDDWCNPADVAAVMARVDHPAIAVNWDAAHPVRTEGWTLADSYSTLRRWIRHTHVHDLFVDANRPDYTAFGTGDIDHKQVLALLRSGGYDGYLSGEWINWEPPDVHLPREIATLRGYERALA
ncbi:MAG: sugar phosphate isomerase/epimerase [Caldilineaceae bacterium]|nr:sugar phosphate isomerase/epimerase [Caldilineaceae bacterium]